MNRESVNKAQKQKKSTLFTLFPATNFLQRKTINRIDLVTSTVDTGSPSGQQIDKPNLPGSRSHFNHDFSMIPVMLNSPYPIQAKFKIGQPDDKYEQEADRVAEQVMRMPDPRTSSPVCDSSLANGTIPRGGTIQRACASCSEEYKTAEDENRLVQTTKLCPKCRTQARGLIQTKQITPLIQAKTTGSVTPEVSSGIQSLQSGGRPLSESERSFFEPRFWADFSRVRIHNNTRAATIARSVNARAFTFGRNVVFGAGEYFSDSLAGRKLLAHELTHVLQQRGQSGAPTNNNRTSQLTSLPSYKADRVDNNTLSDQYTNNISSVGSGGQIQREYLACFETSVEEFRRSPMCTLPSRIVGPGQDPEEVCGVYPGGSADCEIANEETGELTGRVNVEVNETNPCVRPCVELHEGIHVRQMQTLCPALQNCYQASDEGRRPVTDCFTMALRGAQAEC